MTAVISAQFLTKICAACGLSKPYSEFWRQISSADGRQEWCVECHSAADGRTPAAHIRKRRTSPYRRMDDVLTNIEEHIHDPQRVQEIIDVARKTYQI